MTGLGFGAGTVGTAGATGFEQARQLVERSGSVVGEQIANSRNPIFADNNLLVNAFERGSTTALSEIRAGQTFLTQAQYNEFLHVNTSAQVQARLNFLNTENITVYTDPDIINSQVYLDVYNTIVKAGHGVGDAMLAGYAKATGIEAVTMYQGGVMSNEDNNGDLIGFKGILCRWIYRFAIYNNQPDILEWLKYNAATAWNNRNKAGLIWTTWNSKTSDTKPYDIFGLSTAVSLLNNCRSNINLIVDASDRIEMDQFDSCRGITTEESSEGEKYIDSITDGFYTVYHNIDFGNGGFTKAVFRAATPNQDGTIEIRLGGINGKIIGKCEITNTGGWNVWETFQCNITEVSGIQDLYLIFKGNGPLFQLTWFQFVQ